MQVQIGTDHIKLIVRGYVTKAPAVTRWRPRWVAHFGHERTEYTYVKETEAHA